MKATLQVVLEPRLVAKTETTAKRKKLRNVAAVRSAVDAHLRRLDLERRIEREIQSYLAIPQDVEEVLTWEPYLAWPED
ncbi:MAG: hypothetical protein FJW32_23140 [Acidobacteria bacterium]|nr:hypothetical protein [Acidobacteriota bacterium]